MAKQEITLAFIGIVKREEKQRSSGDRRRKINWVVAEYRGTDGEIYRKAFESYGEPEIPKTGTHETLNALKIQY